MVPDETDLRKLGKDYKPNRAERRKKPTDDPKYTKASHKYKKERAKNAPTRQQRIRAIAKSRKARKESYSQVS